MEKKIEVPDSTKKTVLDKAQTVVEAVKEKAAGTKEELLRKAKESELAAKAKEKLEDVKEGAKNIVNKVAEKFSGKK